MRYYTYHSNCPGNFYVSCDNCRDKIQHFILDHDIFEDIISKAQNNYRVNISIFNSCTECKEEINTIFNNSNDYNVRNDKNV